MACATRHERLAFRVMEHIVDVLVLYVRTRGADHGCASVARRERLGASEQDDGSCVFLLIS